MKYCLLTGASSGLGLFIARSLLENGYFVIMHYYKHDKEVKKLFNKYPNSSMVVKANLKDEKEIDELFKSLKDIKLDILINNAAIENLSDLSKKDSNSMMEVFKLNTIAPFLLCKYFGTDINDNEGYILNISSDNTIDKYDEVSIEYDVSKSGLNMLTKEFSLIYPKAHVNALCFGWLDTPMNNFSDDILEQLEFVSMDKAIEKVIKMLNTEESGKIEVVR